MTHDMRNPHGATRMSEPQSHPDGIKEKAAMMQPLICNKALTDKEFPYWLKINFRLPTQVKLWIISALKANALT